jgi:glycosyltransferase involved in cell wall biosynthesis
MGKEQMKFLFMEPFFGGSHKSFALGWQAHSRHDIELLTLPDTFWKWRMRGASLQFIGMKKDYRAYDGIITSDMMNLADFIALAEKPLPPCLVYFHENQLTYPLFPGKQRDEALGLMNITTALAARRIVFNSQFHRRDFLDGASRFLNRIPGGDIVWCNKALAVKSCVLHPGCPFPAGLPAPGIPWLNPPLIIWNHRWEFDKNPGPFFKALKILKMKKIPFQLALLGEGGPKVPAAFESARLFFQKELVTSGYVESREAYEEWLRRGAIVVSTANQENFGISVVEAVRQGCIPLLPDRLAYPEIIPTRFHNELIYREYRYLPRMLENIIVNYPRFAHMKNELVQEMGQYAWEQVIDAYDRELDLLVGTP